MQAALAKYGKYGRFGAGVLDKAGAIAGGTLLEPFENSSLEISSGLFSAIKRDLPGPDWDKAVVRGSRDRSTAERMGIGISDLESGISDLRFEI